MQGHRIRQSAKITLIVLGVLCLGLIAARLYLPHFVLEFANRKLDQIPEYKGHIDDVDIALWRGAYTIKGIRLEKISGAAREPFFSASSCDFSVQWRALLHKALVAEIQIDDPKVNFVVAATKKESQTSVDSSWTDRLKEMVPMDINRFRIRSGAIHFRDLTRTPKVDVYLDKLDAEAVGLTNRPGKGESLPATFQATARVMNAAPLKLNIRLDPLAKAPTFDMDGELRTLPLTVLNDFLRAYANVDAEGGTFSLFTEMAAEKGNFKGYIKPLLKDVHILDLEKDKENPLHLAWEALVAGVESIFENKSEKQAGTQIPFSGKFSDPKAGIFPAVGYLLRNAFIEALRPSLSHSVAFAGLTGGKPTKGAGTVEKKDLKKDEKSGK